LQEIKNTEPTNEQFERFESYLYRTYFKSLEGNGKKVYGGRTQQENFETFCYWNGYFFNMAKKHFARHKLNQEERYAFLKQAYFNGFSRCFNYEGAKLITPDFFQFFDIEYLELAISRNDYNLLAELFQNNTNKELFDFLRNDYRIDDGYTARRIIEQMQTPQGLDYSQEVAQNDFIDIFNTIYDDACVYEKWPSKITKLACANNKTHLNQDNLISLAKSLYDWGTGFDKPTYIGMRKYYEILTSRINDDDLTLYDYQSDTLGNMKLQIGKNVGTSIIKAPYTNYVLEQLGTRVRAEKKIDDVLKQLILFNPEEQRKIYRKL